MYKLTIGTKICNPVFPDVFYELHDLDNLSILTIRTNGAPQWFKPQLIKRGIGSRSVWKDGQVCGEVYHDFSVTIIGYFLFTNLDDDIVSLRAYALNVVDLFRGANSRVAAKAHVYSATADVGYYVIVDYPIYRFIVTLNVRMIEV